MPQILAKAKIMLVGCFAPSALENIYIHNLNKLGYEPLTFEIYRGYHDTFAHSLSGKINHKLKLSAIRKSINQDLIQFYDQQSSPQIVILFKGADISPSTLLYMKNAGSFLVNYNPDHPLYFERNNRESKNISEGIRHYDLYGTYALQIAEDLQKNHQINSVRIPFGYDDRYLTQEVKTADFFSFIGTWDRKRQRYLTSLDPALPLHIYGGPDWVMKSFKNKIVMSRYQNQYLQKEQFGEVIRNSMGVINLLREQNMREASHNMRTFEAPGNGGLLITERTAEQEAFFEEDKEAVFFSSKEELNDKLRFLAKNTTLIEGMKKASYQRSIDSGYSYLHRAKELVHSIHKHYS